MNTVRAAQRLGMAAALCWLAAVVLEAPAAAAAADAAEMRGVAVRLEPGGGQATAAGESIVPPSVSEGWAGGVPAAGSRAGVIVGLILKPLWIGHAKYFTDNGLRRKMGAFLRLDDRFCFGISAVA